MNLNELIDRIKKIKLLKNDLQSLIEEHEKIIILGNGGSNSVASHIAQDYTKMLDKKAFSFSDASRLTCYINDYGMGRAYTEFLRDFVEEKTLVILISSSGMSENILEAAKWCEENKISWISLSGFMIANKLKLLANEGQYNRLNLWIDSYDYGIVECTHLIFLHSILGEK